MGKAKNKSKQVGGNKKALTVANLLRTMLFYVYSHQNIMLPRYLLLGTEQRMFRNQHTRQR